jgi:hypothetical protein
MQRPDRLPEKTYVKREGLGAEGGSEERLKELAPDIQIRALDYLDKLYGSADGAS